MLMPDRSPRPRWATTRLLLRHLAAGLSQLGVAMGCPDPWGEAMTFRPASGPPPDPHPEPEPLPGPPTPPARPDPAGPPLTGPERDAWRQLVRRLAADSPVRQTRAGEEQTETDNGIEAT
jgi:hypothetical protein